MPLTAQELDNVVNGVLDHYLREKPLSQTIQDKPLLSRMRAKQKTFPGGRGEIKGNVKGDYSTSFVGYEYDDTVSYGNPANMKQFSYTYKELHAGISFTNTELKKNGISIVDTLSGENTTQASETEMLEISNILDDKMEDMDEGMARSFNNILWRDGTQSSKVFGGVTSIVALDPTTGVAGGIDRSQNTWWRNRAKVGANKITHSTSLQTLTKTLRNEVRQLRRYGGKPNLVLCGSTALERLEAEVAEKGTYTQEGFVKNGTLDVGLADISLRGVGQFLYDPTMDELGMEEFIYILDDRFLQLLVMQNEDMKKHSPARPPEKYVTYRGVTWTGTLISKKMNCHGVYETA